MNDIRFSVITIVYNGENEIERTIQSVIGQTYRNIEYILVDGASKDNTMAVVEQYKEHFSTIISEPDKGIYNAMNKGLDAATGDYVYFANCGDMIASNIVLEEVAKKIKLNDNPDLLYGGYQERDGENVGPVIPCRSHTKAWYGMFASHQSTFCKRSVIEANGIRFDETYKIAADYKFMLTMVKHGRNFVQLPFSISLFDITGVSCNNQDLGLMEADRARKEVMNMSWLRRKLVIVISLMARFAKKNFGTIYRWLRNR